MRWKEHVAQLEREGNFDIAIFLLEKVIQDHPNDMNASIYLLYRLMSSIVDNSFYWTSVSCDPLKNIKKMYYDEKCEEYRILLQRHFDESYACFSTNAEYLFYASGILMPQYWFCCMRLDDTFLENMQQRAFRMGYNTILEKMFEYKKSAESNPLDPEVIRYAHSVLDDPDLQRQLASKGAVAKYVLGPDVRWAQKIVQDVQ